MSYQLNGKVVKIGNEEVISEKFRKREIVLETADQYPQQYPIQFVNDKCGLADKLTIGCEVTAHINLKGKKYQNKTTGADAFFLSLECWKIDIATATIPTPEPKKEVEGDQLPF